MRQGQLKKPRNGCLWVLGVFWASPILIAVLVFPFGILWCAWDEFRQGRIGNGLVFLLMFGGICFGVYKYLQYRQRKQKGKEIKPTPDSVELQTTTGKIQYLNPYRGFLGIGAAGSGKTESIAVPLLSQFISKNFAGIVYAFKFPEFANEIQAFIKANRSDLKHYFLNFNNPHHSDRVNPIPPVICLIQAM